MQEIDQKSNKTAVKWVRKLTTLLSCKMQIQTNFSTFYSNFVLYFCTSLFEEYFTTRGKLPSVHFDANNQLLITQRLNWQKCGEIINY